MQEKLRDFMDNLPPNKPAITSWYSASRKSTQKHNSTQQPTHTEKPSVVIDASQSVDVLDERTLSTTRRGAPEVLHEPEQEEEEEEEVTPSTDIVTASHSETSLDKTFAELANCRYLRIGKNCSVKSAWEEY